MKHNYITCDVCGEKIIGWGEDYFRVPKLMSIRGFGITKTIEEVDICNSCWRKFVAYVKEHEGEK